MNLNPIAALAGLALLAGCGAAATEAPPLEGARLGGAFRLTGESGRPLTERDFAGQYRIMYFGFASCPDICPTDLAVIGRALKRFEAAHPRRAAKVTPVFVSVDGGRDTPDVLRTYTDAFHPKLIGATGTKAELDAVTKAYGVYYAIEPGATPADTRVDHSNVATLFGPDGKPLAILPTSGPGSSAEAVAAELDRWVA